MLERKPNTEYILSLSYGKDSLACLEAIRLLGWPLDRIVHAEVWATDTIPADLPPMVEFKAKADAIIKERYGIEVEHVCAMRNGEKLTYEKLFYHVPSEAGARSSNRDIYGWPQVIGGWCRKLKEKDRQSLFNLAPWTGRWDKYRPVSGDSCRRTCAH